VHGFGLIEESDRALDRRGTEVHVPLRRDEIHVPSELLNRTRRGPAHREVRTERVPQSMHAAVGLATGCAGGFALGRFVEAQGLLFHVTARDPVAFSTAVVTLFLVSIGACYVPARRASRVDPTVTLRGE